MSMNQTLNEKVVPAVMKFVNLKALQALKDGVLYTMPLNIIGSLFLLVAAFPSVAYTNFMSSIFGADWQTPLYKVQNGTMGLMGSVCVISIAYIYAKNEGCEPLSASIMSLAVFFITTKNTINFTPKDTKDVFVVGGIPANWLGSQGMISGILIALAVGYIYSWFMKKDIRIKMPEGVPSGVADAFSALIPAAVTFIIADIIYILFKYAFNDSTLVEMIYKVIQTPLQGISDTPGGIFVIAFSIPFLWFFGVHGANVVSGVVISVLQANTADNAALQIAGKLTLANGAHIVTSQFFDNFINMAGSGETLGLVICMLLFAKSAQYKQLSRLGIAPNLFNINEPILFGIPIVMNPIMAVPFIITPICTAMLLYAAIASGLLAPMGGVMPPWTLPPVLSGLLIGGVPYALAQLIFLVLGAVIYFPFFKKADAMAYADELAAEKGNGVEA